MHLNYCLDLSAKGGESDQNVVSKTYLKCLAEEWGPALVQALSNAPNNPSAGGSIDMLTENALLAFISVFATPRALL